MPFTGIDKIVWTRPAEDGVTITRYAVAKVFRDSQGRVYRENHHFGLENADPQSTLYQFTVRDPVNQTHTICDVASHVCHIVSYQPLLSSTVQPVGPFDQGRRYLTRDRLGDQTMSDLPVVGTIEKTLIQPGTIGNDQRITWSREFWYSADLKTNLAVTRIDSVGTQAITLTILSRTDPDPSVFAIPAGYKVQNDRHTAPPQN